MAKIIDNYILIEAIGQGTYGEIHKGRNLISKEAVAVKTIKLDRFLNDSLLKEMIINEIQALKKLEDQHIVRMIKMLKSSNNIYLVYEHLNGGSLANYLQEKGRLSEYEGRQIITNIFKGFKTLNHEKIIHRNINPENLFFNDGIIKIKNFFCCKSSTSQKIFDPENYLYAAPEILLKTQQSQYEDKCDIFSLGLVFYKMFFGTLPFPENIAQEQLVELYRSQDFNPIIEDLSENTNYILNGMLQIDQQKRIEWQKLFHEDQVPSTSGLVNSINTNFASNYQINSQVQQFETVGQQNFYISQQSIQNQITTSPNELIKRRNNLQDKENTKANKENDNISLFTKTVEKDSNISSYQQQSQQQTNSNQQINNLNGQPNVIKQIQTQLFELRYKFNILIQGIIRIEQLESWSAKIKTEICMIFLIKKAIKYINEMIDICQNSDRQWIMSKNKNEIVKILQKDYDELLSQFRFIKQTTNSQHEELGSHEIIEEQYIDNVLIMIAKQISMDLGQVKSSMRTNSQIKSNSFNYEQTSQRNGSFIEQKQNIANQQIFAIFLIDLVKGQIQDEQRPYFKKIEESKLAEILDFKLKAI
ncbi:unnamed protein product (macronuclear) [Paramecium tetraurelia]|uniref:Protein kinase domain-containing protein n=1 Tax=Paramecium tetraurelia TaxID=5888 RepID=A0CX42_PARTE|nr:uncharacterized protein GSPATT00001563001 [Paramecium tetraurelia]CAK75359.1 unnamed protein product [Paramecium tetraurelia]|eukprot:XP_001442756.1 hypothetical protein (macronuclear) [Paramecium tetraurelia strain d4-2]